MNEGQIIVDTGPLVAFLVREETHHDWVKEQFKIYRRRGRESIPALMPQAK